MSQSVLTAKWLTLRAVDLAIQLIVGPTGPNVAVPHKIGYTEFDGSRTKHVYKL